MQWNSASEIATNLLSANPVAVVVACLVAFLLPLALHLFLYRTAPTSKSDQFILLGSSGSGKTALCAKLEKRTSPNLEPRPTHTSQVSSTFSVALHPAVRKGSDKYRSVNDPTLAQAAKQRVTFSLRDTPGHGKLRDLEVIAQLLDPSKQKQSKIKVRGVIFMIDASTLMDAGQLADVARYLYDVLIILHRFSASTRARSTPVLVAANKQDLFAAIPAAMVKEKLEAEIEAARETRRKGVINPDAEGDDETDAFGNQSFTFQLLEEESGVKVDFLGGSVTTDYRDDATSGLRSWEEWMGQCL
ncbi:hypothetical protein H112_08116 [Trichophyton rubrum D6]|uniref:Signal recognition particle receptor subunit beta n=4 Tax=Trichophyton TaxID=5550 RepID=A0A178ETE5_TRIRU|nr:Signal recognition particle receptor subunit beta [Trichophyton rubrum CBS 118892]EZF10677.1 hypothetical protein H100_08144 [Trichophyton rubrum MR850]EZF37516.1 hypothetical protein H102_08100 [Trichophyton rubrum CBS 100081]EZF48210.1 hypothetical protein H103_08128 [Trichophyton rubrum CBS 288.86]EZF58807.1 hypothetical protein H104_08075 [Trichophyton rubrum CBS 289.86]EZF69464.1 hypothetical protein H105_08127 [Trichophyton soudanense CBS 452.61]EZF80118.1 hypothetical protein H110_0